jgi:hypothetical protein
VAALGFRGSLPNWQVFLAKQAARIRLGLGLAIVHRLVALHGGTVTAHSPGLGKGCEFRVRIPLAPYQPPFDAATRMPVAALPARSL